MSDFLLLLFAIPLSVARNDPRHRAKVVEDYVVSADLDHNNNYPQLQHRSQLREVYRNDATEPPSKRDSLAPPPNHFIDDADDVLQDRDLLLHHHHLPPPPHPPPPPPPVGLVYAPSFFAIGLITFLLLLNSLQTSLLLVLKSKGSLLGSMTGALGRRRRSLVNGTDFGMPDGLQRTAPQRLPVSMLV